MDSSSPGLAAEFYRFRRDAYDYRAKAEDDLKEAIDGLRRDAKSTSRWAIGIAITIGVAMLTMIGLGLVPNYVETLRTVDKVEIRQDAIAKHSEVQDKTFESINERLRVLEQEELGGHQKGKDSKP